jgi:carboxylesterase type B
MLRVCVVVLLACTIGGESVSEFLGQRYALPPVGALRFSPAVIAPFNASALANSKFGKQCIQSKSEKYRDLIDEDCLFANIWAPNVPPESGSEVGPTLLPIFFWVSVDIMRLLELQR